MKRRKFIRNVGLTAAGTMILPGCLSTAKIPGSILGTAATGHMLREPHSFEPTSWEEIDVVIVGGGVSGLSAARMLKRSGINNFKLLELAPELGGNASSGKNDLSEFPLGAHYVPLPNPGLPEYEEFLKQHSILTGHDEKGLPIYNEKYLCFAPQERLYINGSWQEGLIPDHGVPADEKKQIARFLHMMEALRQAKGSDGLYAFDIPVDRSSKDEDYQIFDKFTMLQWLERQGLTSRYLREYVNYACRDDFGTDVKDISAWVGIHYFAGRKGKSANGGSSDLLTWPQGNGFLIQCLRQEIQQHCQTQALVTAVKQKENGVELTYMDMRTHQVRGIRTKHCIMAVPQFVLSRLYSRSSQNTKTLEYTPWAVVNLRVAPLQERSGSSICWDNVIHGSSSLGYVNACHQLLRQHVDEYNLTWYLPLSGANAKEERQLALNRSHDEWVELVMKDLSIIHPDIREKTKSLDVQLWGHAMARPTPGTIFGEGRREMQKPEGRVHFAHTDLAGISIFEEGFSQGIRAARDVLKSFA